MSSPHGLIHPTYRPSIRGRNGVVSSGDPLASQAGIRTMQAGGSAVDAAIATAAALGVVELSMSGAGGDGFILIYDAASGKVHGLNATGPAPAGATREHYLERGGIPMKGMLSVSVPGLVDGWLKAHERFGKLSLAEVFAPAIDLCENGFPVGEKLAAMLAEEHQQFSSDLFTRAIFEPGGRPLEAGELLFQRDLGNTLHRIAGEGRSVFYEGAIAQEIAAFSSDYGGLVTSADLGAFQARWEEPIHVDYHGYRVYEMPPNSSGHVLLQELNLVEQFDLAGMGCLSPESVHVMVEAKRLAFADREEFMADPDWVDVPLAGLLDKQYARERARGIDPGRMNPEVGPGSPEPREDTTCFCVADGDGNAVCVLQSLQSGFGSGLVAGKTGVLLNNRMTYWHLEEGHANYIAGGQKAKGVMTPCVVMKDGNLVAAVGAAGGYTIPQTVGQVITKLTAGGMDMQLAIASARMCLNRGGGLTPIPEDSVTYLEAGFPPEVYGELADRGHNLVQPGNLGGVQGVYRDAETGALAGGSDPRRDGHAIAW